MITFKKTGLTDLVISRGRILPSSEPIIINQDKLITSSNNVIIIDKGINTKLIKLSFKFLTKDNYDGAINGLKTWFENSQINWMENTFTLVDENNVEKTVRLWDDKFDMKFEKGDTYSVSLTLRDES